MAPRWRVADDWERSRFAGSDFDDGQAGAAGRDLELDAQCAGDSAEKVYE